MTLPFPLARYHFSFEVTAPLRLPEYAGSALRGAFGHALRQLACTTRDNNCDGCLLHSTCAYPAIFAPPPRSNSLGTIATPPVPYVIEPPPWGARDYMPGETLEFGFNLIGRATENLPLCIMAWRRAFSRGVGAGKGTAELRQISVKSENGEICIHKPGGVIEPHAVQILLEEVPVPERVTLNFITPLRLQENGRALTPNRLFPRPLLTALLRRASLLAEYHGSGPLLGAEEFRKLAATAELVHGNRQLEWHDWTRRSSRQQRTMQLGGLMGSWQLAGDIAPFMSFLRLGACLHVGKEASFGMGRYLLEIPGQPSRAEISQDHQQR